jgi:hypothetical protein
VKESARAETQPTYLWLALESNASRYAENDRRLEHRNGLHADGLPRFRTAIYEDQAAAEDCQSYRDPH